MNKMAKKTTEAGAQKKESKSKCSDKYCPFHSNMGVRGRTFKGKIIGNVFQKTVTVEWERRRYVPKYERYEKKRTRIRAHSTPCIEVKEGNIVKIMESRPISKTKKFIIIEKI